MEHNGEKDVLFTTAGHKSIVFNFQVRNVRLPIVSSERFDGTAESPGKRTLDLDLIGGTLWLELWDPRPFVHGASTLICPVTETLLPRVWKLSLRKVEG